MTLAQWTDLIRGLIVALIVPGGPIVAWITVRHRRQSEPVSRSRVAEAELTHVLDDTGIAARWQAYADGIEKRLNKRLTEAERQIRKAEARNDLLLSQIDVHQAYERLLRTHIARRLPPPPPAYPPAIDPACGWDHGEHVVPKNNQEDS